jgi:hypothetical protein
MVDSEERQIASELIAKYLSLEITNDELSDDFPRDKRDPALEAIWWNLWLHYSDTHSHKAERKHQLSPEAKELFERGAAFLRTDLEYKWPPYKWIGFEYALWRLLGLGQRLEQKFDVFKSHGDFEVRPFIRREDYTKFASTRANR